MFQANIVQKAAPMLPACVSHATCLTISTRPFNKMCEWQVVLMPRCRFIFWQVTDCTQRQVSAYASNWYGNA